MTDIYDLIYWMQAPDGKQHLMHMATVGDTASQAVSHVAWHVRDAGGKLLALQSCIPTTGTRH